MLVTKTTSKTKAEETGIEMTEMVRTQEDTDEWPLFREPKSKPSDVVNH